MNRLKKLFFVLLLSCYANYTLAYNDDVKLSDLQMPVSPAFILLDVAPVSIEKPTTVKAFSTSILNNINQTNGIPDNFAFDFAPYWFFKHSKLTALKYMGLKDGVKQNPFSQLGFGNLSIAYVNTPEQIDSATPEVGTRNYFSTGIRTTILQFRDTKPVNKINDLNVKITKRQSDLNSMYIEKPRDEIANIIDRDSVINSYLDTIGFALEQKPVFALDFSGASSWVFEKDNFNTGTFNRAGVWLTANVWIPLEKLDLHHYYIAIYCIGRGLMRSFDNKDTVSLDAGSKIEIELDRFSLAYEYIVRYDITDNNNKTFRSSGMLKYRISDGIQITSALGRNFGDANNLIAHLGIAMGFSGNNQHVNRE
jgi:hypothetical protein